MHELFVAAYCFPCCGMYNRHCNLLEMEIGCCALTRPKFCWRVQIGGLLPHTFGKEINSFLAYYISRSYATLNQNESYFLGVVVPGLVNLLVDFCGLVVGGAGVIGASMRRRFPILTIKGVLPGMLWCVRRECVLAVFFNCLGAVGFGAVIIGGASVIRVIG
jgi:hypothetical protein